MKNQNTFVRVILFLLCIPSGGILLLKTYGIAAMSKSVWNLFVPSLILLIIITAYIFFKKHQLRGILLTGALGGLIGTFGYDLIRVPLMLMGSRVFAPISMYGMWLTDATVSSSITDLTGWLYHFSNGITFGIMYALFMKGKNMWWAVLYALLLETIFVISPFGELFGLTTKPLSLFAAYLGHVAYGYPLGKMVQNQQSSLATIKFFKKGIFVSFVAAILFIGFLLRSISDNGSNAPVFTLIDEKITPNIIRIDKGTTVYFQNFTATDELLILPLLNETISLESNKKITRIFQTPGIYQILVKNKTSIKGVFVISEPVEQFK